MTVKNEEKDFFVPLCLCARNGPAMTERFCTVLSKMVKERSQENGAEYSKRHSARRVSKMGETIESGKWKVENYKTGESEDRMKTIKSKTNYAQRLSNDSEWLGNGT